MPTLGLGGQLLIFCLVILIFYYCSRGEGVCVRQPPRWPQWFPYPEIHAIVWFPPIDCGLQPGIQPVSNKEGFKSNGYSSKIRLPNNSDFCPAQPLLLFLLALLREVARQWATLWRSPHGKQLCLLPTVIKDLSSAAWLNFKMNLLSLLTTQIIWAGK